MYASVKPDQSWCVCCSSSLEHHSCKLFTLSHMLRLFYQTGVSTDHILCPPQVNTTLATIWQNEKLKIPFFFLGKGNIYIFWKENNIVSQNYTNTIIN